MELGDERIDLRSHGVGRVVPDPEPAARPHRVMAEQLRADLPDRLIPVRFEADARVRARAPDHHDACDAGPRRHPPNLALTPRYPNPPGRVCLATLETRR